MRTVYVTHEQLLEPSPLVEPVVPEGHLCGGRTRQYRVVLESAPSASPTGWSEAAPKPLSDGSPTPPTP